MFEKLREKFLTPENVGDEHIDIAYNHLQRYCDEHGLDLIKFVKNENWC